MSSRREKGLRYLRGLPQKPASTRVSTNSVIYYSTSPSLYITKTSPILRLLETMVARGFRRIFVANTKGILEGVVTPMEIVKYLFWKSREDTEAPVLSLMSTSVAKIMRRDVISINQSKSMVESIMVMKHNGVNGLAVVDRNGRLKAVLTVRDVLERFNRPLAGGPVEEYISKSPVCVSTNRTLREGIEAMISSEHRRLPCLDGSKPVGLFSSRSIVKFLGGKDFLKQSGKTIGSLMNMSVTDFTVRDVPVLDPSVSISEAWEIVKRSSYGSALVVKSGSLEGFLTEMDFLKAVKV